MMLEIYSSYLTNENLPQEYKNEFEIHKNNHDMNVFILKAYYVKKTSSYQPFDCSVDFF